MEKSTKITAIQHEIATHKEKAAALSRIIREGGHTQTKVVGLVAFRRLHQRMVRGLTLKLAALES